MKMKNFIFLVSFLVVNFFCLQGAQDEDLSSAHIVSNSVSCQNSTVLPEDILLNVLSFLDIKSLAAVGRATRYLHGLYRSIIEKRFPYSFGILPEIPDFYNMNIVISNDGSTIAGIRYCSNDHLDNNDAGVDLSIPFCLTKSGYKQLQSKLGDWFQSIDAISFDGSVIVGKELPYGGGFKNCTWVNGKVDLTNELEKQIRFKNWKCRKEIFESQILRRESTHIVGASSDGWRVAGNIHSNHKIKTLFLWQNGEVYDMREILAAKGLLPEGCVLRDICGISANGLFIAGECSFKGSEFVWKVCIPPSFGASPLDISLRKTLSMTSRTILTVGSLMRRAWCCRALSKKKTA